MPEDSGPLGVISFDQPQRIEHVFSPTGGLGLDIDVVFPGETRPTILRVTMSKDQLLGLLAQLEATRQQLGFPLPAVFSQQQTRQ